MIFTNEQIAKAKQAKTAEELLALAKASGIEMTEEQAKTYFAELNRQGELSDDELNAVAGGAKGEPKEYDVDAAWAPDGCGCGSYSPKDSGAMSRCGNCIHFNPISPKSYEGKCRREFDC